MNDAATLLKQLQNSELFRQELPKRMLVNHATWANLSAEERHEKTRVGSVAIKAVRNFHALAEQVRALGRARYEPAVPTLVELWRECAVQPVRVATGHALREIGSAEARSALADSLQDADHFSVFMAVRAVFDTDALGAF